MRDCARGYYPHLPEDFDKSVRISKLPIVYVISTPDFEYIKVGKTKSLKQRLINLQSGCPFDLTLWLGVRTPRHDELEKVVHQRLAHRLVRGEWFSPSAADLDALAAFFTQTNVHVREVFNALL